MKVRLDDIKLYIAMSRSGLNTGEIAEKAGISRNTLSLIKNGKICTPQTAQKIATALEVDVTELIEN